jgi:hypothetical protein
MLLGEKSRKTTTQANMYYIIEMNQMNRRVCVPGGIVIGIFFMSHFYIHCVRVLVGSNPEQYQKHSLLVRLRSNGSCVGMRSSRLHRTGPF